ncbi:hypothetical protein J7E97_16055 [Streptomyces sp. ISL-66]|uniref:hypothetical protein n=1 Tax=Streptomyces sp. ISL-66 TaxID=2819186 RepID=UPI001BEBBF6F|nr:hypothetical protein [Streptomyces sp. ISL-66]MBT2469348.1 hypothetical protein [Streptomyces sp. ISL-66]
MQINGAEQRGHVLLIAGDRAAHRRTVQVAPSANLAALSTVPVPVLLDSTVPADVVHLDGVRDQNTLLLRLRNAAATPGPLLVYLSGRLTVDRKGRRLHLAQTSTNTMNVRYTALPWEWLTNELRSRPAGWTILLFDLAADKPAWAELQGQGSLSAANAAVYGVVSPPGYPGSGGVSPYTHHLIEQLRRHPDRPNAPRLHALTVAAADLPPGALILPAAPAIEPERLPVMSNLQRLLAGDTSVLSDRRRRAEPREVAPGLERVPSALTDDYQYLSPSPVHVPPPAVVQDQPVPQQQIASPQPVRPSADSRGRWVLPQHEQQAEPQQQPVRAPHPVAPAAPPAAQQPAPVRPPVPQPTPRPQAYAAPQPQAAPAQPPAPAPVQQDPRPNIHALAQAGQFREAARLAQAWEQHALQTHGIDSPQATQWVEIRADLAKSEGNYLLATQLWIAAGRTRLAHQAVDAPEVLATASSAHYCWTQLTDPAQARACGPELISLLRALPTLDRRHLSMAQQRLEYLNNAPSRR